MANALHVLFIEDSQNDCDLLLEHIKGHGYTPTFVRAETETEMSHALNTNAFHVILCDHNLPHFDVGQALTLAKLKDPTIPFIVVSGSVSEEVAVKTLKSGAKDYIIKNKLSRLIPAIEREILEAKTHAMHLRVEAELHKKELELRQAQKLEAVGQLAGGVAHDFNNVLAVILMQAEASLEMIHESPELRKICDKIYRNIEQIQKAGNRAANLTRQLLAFSRKQVIQPQVVDVNELIREMEKMLSRVIEENIKLSLSLDLKSKHIKVDPGHFEQIIMNLVVNSRDAMPSGGTLQIKSENVFVNEEPADALESEQMLDFKRL